MAQISIAIYSDDSSVRESVRRALGKRLNSDLPENLIHEFATADSLRLFALGKSNSGKAKVDLFILDGEAVPEGGLGVARQLKDEIFNCPPILVLVAREQDAWLAGWSRAEGVVTHPVDPFTLGKTALSLLSSKAITK
jgi:DNA-binding response OmpR family regulator